MVIAAPVAGLLALATLGFVPAVKASGARGGLHEHGARLPRTE